MPDKIPLDIFQNILFFARPEDRIKCKQLSKKINNSIDENIIKLEDILRDFNLTKEQIVKLKNPEETYFALYKRLKPLASYCKCINEIADILNPPGAVWLLSEAVDYHVDLMKVVLAKKTIADLQEILAKVREKERNNRRVWDARLFATQDDAFSPIRWIELKDGKFQGDYVPSITYHL